MVQLKYCGGVYIYETNELHLKNTFFCCCEESICKSVYYKVYMMCTVHYTYYCEFVFTKETIYYNKYEPADFS